jgi:hypothetical protein
VTLLDAFTAAEILFGKNVQVTQTVVRQGQLVTIECSIGYRNPHGVHFWKASSFEDAIKTARGTPPNTL